MKCSKADSGRSGRSSRVRRLDKVLRSRDGRATVARMICRNEFNPRRTFHPVVLYLVRNIFEGCSRGDARKAQMSEVAIGRMLLGGKFGFLFVKQRVS